jgi:hypothetical protein
MSDQHQDKEIPLAQRCKAYFQRIILNDIFLSALILLVIWKILDKPIKIEGLSFNDLLALLLALFSVYLSIIFYFKANDTSNMFYNETRRFTKDMSELLGRIEEGFGEKLRHLDEGYIRVRDRLDNIDYARGATYAQVKKEEDKLNLFSDERDRIIADFAAKSKVNDEERNRLIKELESANENLAEAKLTLSEMKKGSEDPAKITSSTKRKALLLGYIISQLQEKSEGFFDLSNLSVSEIKLLFDNCRDRLGAKAIVDMRSFGFVDENQFLTTDGAISIQRYAIE